MDSSANLLVIDLRSNAQLKEYFSRLQDGEEFELEITGMKRDSTAERVTCVIKSVGIQGDVAPPGETEEEPGTIEPEPDQPVSMTISAEPKAVKTAVPGA